MDDHKQDTNDEPVINIPKNPRITAPLAVILAVSSVIVSVTLAWSATQTDKAETSKRFDLMESRIVKTEAMLNETLRTLQELQTSVAVIKNDVQWTRSSLARKDPRKDLLQEENRP